MGGVRALAAVIGLLCCAVVQAQPAPLQGVSLRDQQSRPLAPATLQGRVVLLHFIYTGCSATCPTQVRELAAVLDALTPEVRAGLRFVSVSLDPHDTPASLREFAHRLDADREGWLYTSGEPADLDRLATRLRAYDERRPAAGLADHRTSLFVFDASGALMQRYAGVPVDRARLQRELSQLVLGRPALSSSLSPRTGL